MNIHTPERSPNESQADYRTRRALSKAEANRITRAPKQPPAISPLDVSRFFLGQHTNPGNTRRAKRDAKASKREQHPRQLSARKHKLHAHPLKDAPKSAYTLTGRPRRMWLAGISAKRGY